MVVEATCRENSVERLLVVSLTVTLHKIRDRAGSAATDEFLSILHQENFNISVLKEVIKNSADCQVINQDVIDRFKACQTFISSRKQQEVFKLVV